jgi:hypothetical protein
VAVTDGVIDAEGETSCVDVTVWLREGGAVLVRDGVRGGETVRANETVSVVV